MIRLAAVIDTFLPDLERDYVCLLSGQSQALGAIQRCPTENAAIYCHNCAAHDGHPDRLDDPSRSGHRHEPHRG
jgi:hypothetical protein